MIYTLDQLFREARKLPPHPQTAQKALALVRDPHTNAAELAMAGLLCDIGKLILEKLFCEVDLCRAEGEQSSFLEAERVNFGVDHAFLGAEIARRWQLPENLVDAIAYHHEPRAARVHPVLVAVVHVADITMMILGIGIGLDGLRYSLDREALKALCMAEEDVANLVECVAEELSKTNELFTPY